MSLCVYSCIISDTSLRNAAGSTLLELLTSVTPEYAGSHETTGSSAVTPPRICPVSAPPDYAGSHETTGSSAVTPRICPVSAQRR